MTSRFRTLASLVAALVLLSLVPGFLTAARAVAPASSPTLGASSGVAQAAVVTARKKAKKKSKKKRKKSRKPAPKPVSTTTTYAPAALPASTVVPNSMRGQYRWLGYDSQVAGWETPDTYFRDQVYWGRLERTRGTYDFSWIDEGLRQAEERGGRFGFRVMAYCPGCWMNWRSDKDTWPQVTPTWLPMQAGSDVPDWNSPVFAEAWEELFAELGRRYGNDPRIGWVDVGGYGKWGEWHVDAGQPEISDEQATRLINAVLNAFPNNPVVVNAMMKRLAGLATSLSPRVGLRIDCLGEYKTWSILPFMSSLQDVWKRAPIMSEWCGSSTMSTVAGATQVREHHVSMTSSGNMRTSYANMTATQKAGFTSAMKSAGYRYRVAGLTLPKALRAAQTVPVKLRWEQSGSAPTYDRWNVELQARDAAGNVVWTKALTQDLRKVALGSVELSENVLLDLPAGSYDLRVAVRDSRSYLAPMNLAMPDRAVDGSYQLAKVQIAP